MAAGALVAVVVLAEVGARVWPFSYLDPVPGAQGLPPGWPHVMGTTAIGHDVLALVLRGTRRTVAVAGTAVVVATSVGTLVGAVAGYRRGALDSLLMRGIDLLLTLPPLAVLVVLAARVQQPGDLAVGLVLSVPLTPLLARVVRAGVLASREQGYLLAAQALGASPVHVLRVHVLPGTLQLAAVAATVTAPVAILAETGLTYLGFGVAPPDTSLGSLIARGQGELLTSPWVFLFPGAVVVLLVLMLHALGDAVAQPVPPAAVDRSRRPGSSPPGIS